MTGHRRIHYLIGPGRYLLSSAFGYLQPSMEIKDVAISLYYTRQLTREEIAAGEHRNFMGGFWHEIGTLQFEFLLMRTPYHSISGEGQLLWLGHQPVFARRRKM